MYNYHQSIQRRSEKMLIKPGKLVGVSRNRALGRETQCRVKVLVYGNNMAPCRDCALKNLHFFWGGEGGVA